MLDSLIEAAVAAGEIRDNIEADDIFHAVAQLSMSARDDNAREAKCVVALLADGMRYNGEAMRGEVEVLALLGF